MTWSLATNDQLKAIAFDDDEVSLFLRIEAVTELIKREMKGDTV